MPMFASRGAYVGKPLHLGVERIITGEFLFTLKARHTLGILPELNSDALPENGKEKAIETFEKLVDSANRETPGSIVDRARDATQWCLGTWAADRWNDDTLKQKDLKDLADYVDKKDKTHPVIVSVARIIARLHARGKPNEQEKHSSKPPIEADAEFALAAVGLLLRELKWVR